MGIDPQSVFVLPDLGEGLQDAEIVAWHVAEGDHVVADQPLVSVETDKAVVEIHRRAPAASPDCSPLRRRAWQSVRRSLHSLQMGSVIQEPSSASFRGQHR